MEEEEEKGERKKTTWKSGLDDSILARDTLTTVSCPHGSLYLQTSGGPKGARDPTPICSTSAQRMLTLPTLPTIIAVYGSHYRARKPQGWPLALSSYQNGSTPSSPLAPSATLT